MSGRPKEVTDVEILEQFLLARDPVLTASELSDQFGVTNQAVRDRLDDLKQRGLVQRRTVGAAAVVWWITDDGREWFDTNS